MTRAKPLNERLLSKHYQTFSDAMRECVLSGDAGDAALADALPNVTKDRRVAIAAALGDMSGDAGTEALRKAIDSADASRDLRCASVLALAKRCGESASADFARSLASSDSAVKSYAMRCLAGAGDDRAWDQALKRLKQIIDQPRRNAKYDLSEVTIAIAYLARHVLAAGSVRSTTLLTRIRDHWNGLTGEERSWLHTHWPGCAPDGGDAASIAPPDAEAIRRSVRGPLFDAPAYDFDDPSSS